MSDQDQVKRNVQIVYILQAASFVVGITFIIGFIWDVLKKDEAKGSFTESHISWQMNTFIYAILGMVVSYLVAMVIPSVAYVLYVAIAVMVIIRIAKGWMALNNDQTIEATHVVI